MILRPASLADTAPLAALGRDSFVAAFGDLYQPRDLAAFLDAVFSDEAVAEEIAGARCTHCLAEEEGRLIGYAKLRDPSDYARHSAARRPVELGQLYTAPGATGRGIGAALMDWAIATARSDGHDAILLSVWAENYRAQRFYGRYGFRHIADIDFWVGDHRDDELLYQLDLA